MSKVNHEWNVPIATLSGLERMLRLLDSKFVSLMNYSPEQTYHDETIRNFAELKKAS